MGGLLSAKGRPFEVDRMIPGESIRACYEKLTPRPEPGQKGLLRRTFMTCPAQQVVFKITLQDVTQGSKNSNGHGKLVQTETGG
ncbi:MAG: hypothetical protein AMXMBFR33_11860 [Candidatus Xenobia bacterium]